MSPLANALINVYIFGALLVIAAALLVLMAKKK